MCYLRSRTMLFVRWSDSHKRSKYHTHSAVESTDDKRRKMRCLTQSTQRNPTALTQLVTPTKTEKLNNGNLADTVVEADSPGSSQQIPWNPPCPILASFVIPDTNHTPSVPSIRASRRRAVSLCLSIPKRRMMPVLQLYQNCCLITPCQGALAQR